MIDVSTRMKSAVADCFGVNITIKPSIHIDYNELKELGRLGLTETQILALIYQTITEEGIENGLFKLESDDIVFNLRLENEKVGEGVERHLKLIKRVEMVGNQNASTNNKADASLQMRVKKEDKKRWKKAYEKEGFNNLSSWVVSILNKASMNNENKKESAL